MLLVEAGETPFVFQLLVETLLFFSPWERFRYQSSVQKPEMMATVSDLVLALRVE